MNTKFLYIATIILIIIPLVLATDISVWQGQYYKGTEFQSNIKNLPFNFTVYDALVGGGRATPIRLI